MTFITPTQFQIVKLLMEANIASHPNHAANIVIGLQLDKLETDEARLERAHLYRSWRSSQIYPKTKDGAAKCYAHAIAGEAVPVKDINKIMQGGISAALMSGEDHL